MRRFTTPAWLVKHVLVVVLVAGFLLLGWWQLGRAEQGNALSLGYTFEWPLFAAFVIFLWIREIRLTLRAGADVATDSTAAERVGNAGAAENQRVPDEATAAGVTTFDVNAALARRADAQRAGMADDSKYNQYLAWLAANPTARPRDYRGPEHRPDAVRSPDTVVTKENAHG
jgi:hypothetical protein